MSMKKWKGWFAIHRMTGEERGEPIARSPIYEFSLPTQPEEWYAAHSELGRLWSSAGEPLEGEPGLSDQDRSLRVYRNLVVEFGDMFMSNEVLLPREVERAGGPVDAASQASHGPEQTL